MVIVCGIMRYRKKHKSSSVALPTGTDVVHNNTATIAAAKKEKSINEDIFDNSTYGKFKENIFSIPQNHYETHDDNVYDEVPHQCNPSVSPLLYINLAYIYILVSSH